MNPASEIGFGREAAVYAAVRPSYAEAAVSFLGRELGLGPGARVCDLAAGTGIFTRQLLDAAFDVVAVEPVAAMRAELVAATPGVVVVDGTAEAIPYPDASFDAVTVAQAFHWFDHSAALPEIRRVLRPDGLLVLLWNVRDESVDWVRRWTEVVHGMSGGRPYSDRRDLDWADVFDAAGGFGELSERQFANPFPATAQSVVDRTRSTSFVAAAEPELQAEILAAVEELTATHPDLAGRDQFTFPNHTDVLWSRRLS